MNKVNNKFNNVNVNLFIVIRVKYCKHENQLIRESCEIALDYIDYWGR